MTAREHKKQDLATWNQAQGGLLKALGIGRDADRASRFAVWFAAYVDQHNCFPCLDEAREALQ